MRVKILSGNQAGTIQDLPQIEAEVAIQTGFAEAVVDPPVEVVDAAPAEGAAAPAPSVLTPSPPAKGRKDSPERP